MARDIGMLHTGKAFAQVCEAAELSDAARALRAEGQAPRQYVELLIERAQYPDAVRVLACALPRREAVWWAWVCARRAAGDAPAPAVQASLEATQKWIAEPVDKHRRTAMQLAEAVGFDTPAGCAGLAAFLSGDSLAPPDAEAVPPGEFTAAKAIAGSIVLAAVTAEPKRADETFQGFVEQGMMVAEKTDLWTPPPAAKPGGQGGRR
jgi:hypothetical protein